ncbi:hypothetical protein AFLA_003947 [Aspergillus flavus NRRL3357]|nr:hypothetical protein AFLA_003947 [Aspergillus flavus NRRL3357]
MHLISTVAVSVKNRNSGHSIRRIERIAVTWSSLATSTFRKQDIHCFTYPLFHLAYNGAFSFSSLETHDRLCWVAD